MLVHVNSATGSAKFWLEPTIEFAENRGLRPHQLTVLSRMIKENEDEIKLAWKKHFGHRSDSDR